MTAERTGPLALPGTDVYTLDPPPSGPGSRSLRQRGPHGPEVELEVLPDEHHATIFPTALSRGLQRLVVREL